MKKVAQKDALGCGIACVASICNLSYSKTKSRYFSKIGNPKVGYFCRDLVSALGLAGKTYCFNHIKSYQKKASGYCLGTIVYIGKSKEHPAGHYLLKTASGWMDSWLNFPQMDPVVAGFRNTLPGSVQWIIYPEDYHKNS